MSEIDRTLHPDKSYSSAGEPKREGILWIRIVERATGLPNPLIEMLELVLGGWTLRMLPQRKMISVIHRSEPSAIPDVAQNIPLQRGSIWLFEGHRGQNEIFFQPADIEATLRQLGATKINRRESLMGAHEGTWSTAGKAEDYAIRRAWIMSDHSDECLIHNLNGEEEFSVVQTPFDSLLLDYNGKLTRNVAGDALWVVICRTSETPAKSEQGVELQIRKDTSLDDVLTSIEQYLSSNGYSKFTDCLKTLSAREYLY